LVYLAISHPLYQTMWNFKLNTVSLNRILSMINS